MAQVCLLQSWVELSQQLIDLRNLDLVALNVGPDLRQLLIGYAEILGLAVQKLLTVLDRLFEPGNLCTNLVVPALHLVELIITLGKLEPQFLYDHFSRALLGDCGIEVSLLLAATRFLSTNLILEVEQTQRQ